MPMNCNIAGFLNVAPTNVQKCVVFRQSNGNWSNSPVLSSLNTIIGLLLWYGAALDTPTWAFNHKLGVFLCIQRRSCWKFRLAASDERLSGTTSASQMRYPPMIDCKRLHRFITCPKSYSVLNIHLSLCPRRVRILLPQFQQPLGHDRVTGLPR